MAIPKFLKWSLFSFFSSSFFFPYLCFSLHFPCSVLLSQTEPLHFSKKSPRSSYSPPSNLNTFFSKNNPSTVFPKTPSFPHVETLWKHGLPSFLSISFQRSLIFRCRNPSKIQPNSFLIRDSYFRNAWGLSILFLELRRDLLNFLFHRAHGLLIFIIYVHNPRGPWCGCVFSKFWCLMEVSKWQPFSIVWCVWVVFIWFSLLWGIPLMVHDMCDFFLSHAATQVPM